jgi:hypothetical protein
VPDYKEVYQSLRQAAEEAMDVLAAAQQASEELYLAQTECRLTLLDGEERVRAKKEKDGSVGA